MVTAVGGNVSRFKVGDRVGVGCMVDSCRTCPSCREGEERPARITLNARLFDDLDLERFRFARWTGATAGK